MSRVTHKQAIRLKSIGYPLSTTSEERVSDALQWFRDEKGIECVVELSFGAFEDCFGYNGVYFDGDFITTESYKTFPEAESALLDALIKYEEEKK